MTQKRTLEQSLDAEREFMKPEELVKTEELRLKEYAQNTAKPNLNIYPDGILDYDRE